MCTCVPDAGLGSPDAHPDRPLPEHATAGHPLGPVAALAGRFLGSPSVAAPVVLEGVAIHARRAHHTRHPSHQLLLHHPPPIQGNGMPPTSLLTPSIPSIPLPSISIICRD